MEKLLKLLKNIFNIPYKLFHRISISVIIDKTIIAKNSAISGKTRIYNSKLGKYSYIGRDCLVLNTWIGKYCSIADDCKIGCPSHPVNWLSTSPVFVDGKNILGINLAKQKYEQIEKTLIGNDVWIGNNVLIKSGIIIGDGAIIGMGSIVTKNVEPYSIVAGVPAKIIKYRFEPQIIKKLLDQKWWEKDDISLVKKHITNIQEYINNLK